MLGGKGLGGGGGGGSMASSRGMASRPAFRTCYLCGQQFGSASIGIHVPQCYQKKTAQWQNANPATRGNRPKDPDTVNWQGNATTTKRQLNDDQYREFSSNLSPCPNCARTFAPDRLAVHLRGCNGSAAPTTRSSMVSGKAPRSSQGSTAGTASTRLGSSTRPGSKAGSQARRSLSAQRDKGAPPQLPFCYLCGRQFGTTSLSIHIPQCYAKKVVQWQKADPGTRGKAPKHPDEVKTATQSMSMQEQSEAQFQEFVNNLEPCPNCARRFLPDRLLVHLKSCRPGCSAKPVQAAASARPSQPLPSPASGVKAPATSGRPDSAGLAVGDTSSATDEDVERVHPRRNRIPKSSSIAPRGLTCPHCAVVEYDEKAKFCRECGHNLRSKTMPDPCASCGENVPEGSRFCPTCGEPVNGAAASERRAGAQNENAPTVRTITCPACEAVCDEDGNFCDNCGVMLETEQNAESRTAMYCGTCRTYVDDTTAAFCEDCGAKLVARARQVGDASASRKGDSTSTRTTPSKLMTATAAKSSPSPARASAVARKNLATTFETLPEGAFAEEEEDFSYRQQCPHCGRKFASEAFERHTAICGSQKKRPTFNMTKQRLADVADARTIQKVSRLTRKPAAAAAPKVPTKDWRAESQAFRRAMREARQVDTVLKSGGTAANLPPPTYSENAHYVQCPHCSRRFAPDVADRHIPHCANTVNKPKPPPRRRI